MAIIATAIPSPTAHPAGGDGTVAGPQRILGEVQALIEAVTTEGQVIVEDVGVHEPVTGNDDIAPPEVEWVDSQSMRQLVDRGFDGEHHLPEPVTAKRAGWEIVRVDGMSVHPLVRTAVYRNRFPAPVEHHPGTVVTVGARVDQCIHGQGGENTLGIGGDGDVHPERVPAWRDGELIGAAELIAHRPAQPQHGHRHQILGQHLLLATESATDASGEHPHPVRFQSEDMAQFIAYQEGDLRAGSDHQAPVGIPPSGAAMGL